MSKLLSSEFETVLFDALFETKVRKVQKLCPLYTKEIE